MALERYWPAVPPVQLTADGAQFGKILVTSTLGFKVKQKVVLQSGTQPATPLEVKRVVSDVELVVGLATKPISDRSFNASAFLIADGAFIFAGEQDKAQVPHADQQQATYEQEPTCAWRTMLVDPKGDAYGNGNPLAVSSVQLDNIQMILIQGFLGNAGIFLTDGDLQPLTDDDGKILTE